MKHFILHFSLCILMLTISLQGQAQNERTLLVETIQYDGNTKTNESVIRNYLTIQEGLLITKQQLADDEQRLRQTNFFQDVEILIMPGSAQSQAVVTVKVKERRWPYFQFKSGFNELDGWYISPLGVRLDNLTGHGNYFGYEFLLGDRFVGSYFDFVMPFLGGTEYNLNAKFLGERRNFIHFVEQERFGQDVTVAGLMLGVNGNSGLAKLFSVAVRAENVRADSVLKTFPNDSLVIPSPDFLSPYNVDHGIFKFMASMNIDTRDRQLNPSKGWWGSLTFERAAINRSQTDSIQNFNRVIIDLRRYQPIWKGLTGAIRLKYAESSENAPFFERFYLGGPNSLRGYEDRILTPDGYASHLSQASAELRFPLSARLQDKSRLSGVLFYDAGYAWNDPEKWTFDKLKTGLGFGARIRMPVVGLLRLDFAYPVPSYHFRFHLSLGHTF